MPDNSKDPEILKKEKEEKEKTINTLSDQMKMAMGFNMDSNKFGLKDTPNGPAFVIRGEFDSNKLPAEWKYESNYLLDNVGYAKEGIWRWKDGKREFIPIVHEADKSQVTEYKDADAIENAILAENQHIRKDQIYRDEHSGAIQVVGVVNDIKMGQGLEQKDGKIVDINDYDKKYELHKSLANDISTNAIKSGSGAANTLGVQERMTQSAYHEDATLSMYDKNTVKDSHFQTYDITAFKFSDLKEAYEKNTRNSRGDIITQGNDGDYKATSQTREKDPIVEAQYDLASVWANAYMLVAGTSNPEGAFAGDDTPSKFNKLIAIAHSKRGVKLSQMVDILNEYDMGSKIAVCFLADPKIAKYFNIEKDMTAGDAIAKLEAIKNRASENPMEHGDDNVPVMEMQRYKNNQN